MDIIERIKNNFNKGYFGKAMLIEELPEEYPAWTIKRNEWVGVAVPLENAVVFTERFAKAKIWVAKNTEIEGISYDLLLLTCNDMELRNEFATICSQFVDPGTDGELRRKLIADPESWWSNWKFLLGNISSTQSSYPVLGELTVFERLLKDGKSAVWTGVDSAVHDIELPDSRYEVKSTISRYGYEVTISSIHQMNAEGAPLALVFCRFERSLLGRSVDDVVQNLVSLGCSQKKLENDLSKLGLEKGCTARKEKYKLLEMKIYPIDDSFPAITYDSFVGGTLPKSVVKFTYTVDLSGVASRDTL